MVGDDVVRVLTGADLPDFLRLTAQAPVVNVFAEHRGRLTNLDPRWLGGEVWGRYVEGRLVSALHVGANLVPIGFGPDDVTAYVDAALKHRRTIATIVGPASAVGALWEVLQPQWGKAREVRARQPHLEIATEPLVRPHPGVRTTSMDEFELVYPACVAMYEEEVGLSPEADGGGDLYRARVKQLISRKWQYSLVDDGRVVFKAEVACASPHAAQIQGVYVVPDRRGEGLATRGMAAVVQGVRRSVAPVVSLYVNDFNTAARTAYERVGFKETESFSTVMF